MKKMLLASILVLSFSAIAFVQEEENHESSMLTAKQAQYMRYHGVSINLIDVYHPMKWRPSKFSRRGNAKYEASLTNPYNRGIRCNIEITSGRGENEDFEVIASKAHMGIYADPRSVTIVSGNIEIKRGRGEDGVSWVNYPGQMYKASNCFFVD